MLSKCVPLLNSEIACTSMPCNGEFPFLSWDWFKCFLPACIRVYLIRYLFGNLGGTGPFICYMYMVICSSLTFDLMLKAIYISSSIVYIEIKWCKENTYRCLSCDHGPKGKSNIRRTDSHAHRLHVIVPPRLMQVSYTCFLLSLCHFIEISLCNFYF